MQTAYGLGTLRAHASGTPVITILDLGGGWLPSDLKLAGQCFGTPRQQSPEAGRRRRDGDSERRPRNIPGSADRGRGGPRAQFRLVQSTPAGGGILGRIQPGAGRPGRHPGRHLALLRRMRNRGETAAPAFTSVINAVLAMAALTGVSSFVAAGDSGSTTCGTGVSGTTLSYPAVSPFVTAVGGTRLTLGEGNAASPRRCGTTRFTARARRAGEQCRREPRPAYQVGSMPQDHRAVPDVSALGRHRARLAGVIDGTLQPVGGTSGSTPFTAAATALVAGSERCGGPCRRSGWRTDGSTTPHQPPERSTTSPRAITISPGWDAARPPPATTWPAGLGVPDWAVLPGTLPSPG